MFLSKKRFFIWLNLNIFISLQGVKITFKLADNKDAHRYVIVNYSTNKKANALLSKNICFDQKNQQTTITECVAKVRKTDVLRFFSYAPLGYNSWTPISISNEIEALSLKNTVVLLSEGEFKTALSFRVKKEPDIKKENPQ